jgi:hypothetical protein
LAREAGDGDVDWGRVGDGGDVAEVGCIVVGLHHRSGGRVGLGVPGELCRYAGQFEAQPEAAIAGAQLGEPHRRPAFQLPPGLAA